VWGEGGEGAYGSELEFFEGGMTGEELLLRISRTLEFVMEEI
jgi:hypothetical protein